MNGQQTLSGLSVPPKLLTLDIETANDELLATGYAVHIGVPAVMPGPDVPQEVIDALADPEFIVVCHSTYDLRWFRLHTGIDVRAQLHDTKVLAWLIDENTPLDLEWLARRYVSIVMDKRLSSNGKKFRRDDGVLVPFEQAPWMQVVRYCADDVATARALYLELLQRASERNLLDYFEQTAAPYTNILLDMECRGLPFDVDAAVLLEAKYQRDADDLERLLKQGLPECFNVRSNPQVQTFLSTDAVFVKDRVPVTDDKETRSAKKLLAKLAGEETDTERLDRHIDADFGTFSVDKMGRLYDSGVWKVPGLALDPRLQDVASPTLRLNKKTMGHPWVRDLLAFRKLDKLLGTYVTKFPKVAVAGRVYGRFNQTGTVTGRLSSSDPNLQNIPSRGEYGADIRKLFAGNLVVGDFSQLEPRLMAHFSQDAALLDVFQQGRDLYTEIAGVVTGDTSQRQLAKVFVLAMGYGAGAKKLSELLRLNGFPVHQGEAAAMLQSLQDHFLTYFLWRESTIAMAHRLGYVQTLDGRKRRIETQSFQPNVPVWRKGRGDRQAANAVIQGSAADIMTRVLLHTAKMFPELWPVAQVHDEIVWEYDPLQPPDIRSVETKVLQLAGRGLSVPLEFQPHFGSTWYEAKEGTAPEPVVVSEDEE